jgi:hypothetical protein
MSCVKYMLSVFSILLVFFIAWVCTSYRALNIYPVSPTYLSGYSLQFNWYTPLWLYVSIIPSLCFRWFRIVLVVLNAILMLVFLNYFVIFHVSGP